MADLGKVEIAYPDTIIWEREEGIWLMPESSLLTDLEQQAIFLTWIPYSPQKLPMSWGFWVEHSINTPVWIGPRHTNKNGSICAFEPSDNTWLPGSSIVTLIDLNTLWALRHLYLQNFDRWPGKQVVHTPFERLTEVMPDEFCGCDNPNAKLFKDCCLGNDLKINMALNSITKMHLKMQLDSRKPPLSIISCINGENAPPEISEL